MGARQSQPNKKGSLFRRYPKAEHGHYCRIGDTLFVHGQIIGNHYDQAQVLLADEHKIAWSYGVVPGQEEAVLDVGDWLEQLNTWSAHQVSEWESKPLWELQPKLSSYEEWAHRGGSELIAYGTPGTRWPTVVYCRFLTQGSMPIKYPPALVEQLRSQGVQYVMVG